MTSDFSNSSHFPQEQFDTGPLSWVMPEVREAMTNAGKMLTDALAQDIDVRSTTLLHAKNYLHQAHGALQIVDIDGVSIVTETIEELIERLQSAQLEMTQANIDVILDAFHAVLRYLEDLLSGSVHQPVRLFPYYRALLELKGAERIHPADLFFPALSAKEKIPELAVSQAVVPANYTDLRQRFEKLLLTVLTGKDPQKQQLALTSMHELIREIDHAQTNSQTKAFWVVMRAFVEAVTNGQIENQQYVKQIFGRINLQIRRLMDGVNTIPERLLRDALFFLAQVQHPTPFVANVRQAYDLDNKVPADYVQKNYGQIAAGVLTTAKEQLTAVKNLWGRIANGDHNLADKFSQKMKDLAETGDQLNSPSLSKLLRELSGIARHVAHSADGSKLAIELATSLLFVENTLDHITRLPAHFSERAEEITARLLSVVSGEEPESQAAWMGEISREAQQRQTMAVLMTEMQTSLRQVEKTLDEYFRDPAQHDSLRSIDGVLHQIGGALAILDQDAAMQAIEHTRQVVAQFVDATATADSAPSDGVHIEALHQKVAQNIGALSFFIETLQSQPDTAKKKFSFDEESGIFRSNLLEQTVQKELLPEREEFAHIALPDSPQSTETVVRTTEQELAHQQQESARLAVSLAEHPENKVLQAQLKQSLESERSVATLLDDADASGRANAAIGLLASADTGRTSENLQHLVAATAPVAAPEKIPAAPVSLPQSDEAIDAELLDIFLTEADEVLAFVQHTLPLSREDADNQEHLTSLRRSFHTLKGSSRMVGLTVFGEAGWNIEQVMNLWLSESRRGDQNLYALLEYTAKEMVIWVDELKQYGYSARTGADIIAAAERVKAGLDFEMPQAILMPPEMPGNLSAETATAPVSQLELESGGAATETIIATTPEGVSFETLLQEAELLPEFAEPTPAASVTMDEVLNAPDMPETASAANTEHFELSVFDDLPSAASLLAEPAAPTVAGVADVAPAMVATLPIAADELLHMPLENATMQPAEIPQEIAPPAELEAQETADSVAAGLASDTHQPDTSAADTGNSIAEETTSVSGAKIIGFPDLSKTVAPVDDNIKRIGDLEISVPLYSIYMAETDEIVRFLTQDFAEWRHEPHRHVSIHAIHASHSLAGSSATVGLKPLHELAHSLELVLQRLERHPVSLENAEFDVLDHALETARHMLQKFALSEMAETAPDEVRQLEQLLQNVIARSTAGADEEFVTSTNEKLDLSDLSGLPGHDAITSANLAAADLSATVLPVSTESLPDQSVQIKDELDYDLLPVFLEEGHDLLPMVGQLLRSWQEQPADTAIPQSIARLMHTIKGSARMAGAMGLGQHIHDMETRIESLMHTGHLVRQPLMDDLLARHDHSMQLFEYLQHPEAASVPVVPQVLTAAQELDQFQDAQVASEVQAQHVPATEAADSQMVSLTPLMPVAVNTPATRTSAPATQVSLPAAPGAPVPLVRVRADVLDRLVNQAGEVSISRSRLENEVGTLRASLGELTENVSRLRDQLREVEIQAETQITSRMAHSADREFDPLEFDRFTRLQELTRMMAESVSDVATVQTNLTRTIDGASGNLHIQARLTRELQQDLMRVRMIPFASVSERLYRVTRQTAKELDKRVNLDIRGAGVEMDRGVLEKMVGPFEHLLRNAIVHGIEARDVRRQLGKNETGELLIEIRQEGNEVVIRFNDDGRGLDLAHIRQKALSRGMISNEQAPNDAETASLIFEPGFSTATEITELAGRGVGMDVVRSEAASLGGRVEVSTIAGQGAEFTIHLPLTLAVTQVVLLNAGGRTLAVPSVLVEQVQHLKANALANAYNDSAVMWQGQRVSMYYLSTILGQNDAVPLAQQYTPLLVMKSGTERVAIHVDEIIGNREVVVKNIGPQLARMAGIAGATVLGSGEIVLILNPVPLAQRLEHERARLPQSGSETLPEMGAVADLQADAASTRNRSEPVQGLRTQHTVMVVDDSLTVRRVTQRLLTREGYQVVLAKDGIDALEQLQSVTPHVMLVDIEMPRMDGFDLTRNVRNDARTSHIPIIMITSRTADKHRNYAKELGVNEYFGKPYREDDLLEAITGLIGKEHTVLV